MDRDAVPAVVHQGEARVERFDLAAADVVVPVLGGALVPELTEPIELGVGCRGDDHLGRVAHHGERGHGASVDLGSAVEEGAFVHEEDGAAGDTAGGARRSREEVQRATPFDGDLRVAIRQVADRFALDAVRHGAHTAAELGGVLLRLGENHRCEAALGERPAKQVGADRLRGAHLARLVDDRVGVLVDGAHQRLLVLVRDKGGHGAARADPGALGEGGPVLHAGELRRGDGGVEVGGARLAAGELEAELVGPALQLREGGGHSSSGSALRSSSGYSSSGDSLTSSLGIWRSPYIWCSRSDTVRSSILRSW